MLRLRIKELMKEKGVKAPNKKMMQMGMGDKVAHKYMHDKKTQIAKKDMEALCLFLRCTPNDLFEWIPDDGVQDDPNQPLQKLKPKPPIVLEEIIKNMTQDELREFLEKQKKEEEEKKKKK